MFSYIAFHLVSVVGLLTKPIQTRGQAQTLSFFVTTFWILIIGLRDHVGCDWAVYEAVYQQYGTVPIGAVDWSNGFVWDIGYLFLNVFSGSLNLGVHGVNIVCAAIVCYGVHRIATLFDDPWLTWVIASPFFLSVVAMGTTRQSVAIGFLMIALAHLSSGSRTGFRLGLLLAPLFHKTAILLLPLMWVFLLGSNRLRALGIAFLLVTFLLALTLVGARYQWSLASMGQAFSLGVAIKSSMNLLPALILILMTRPSTLKDEESLLVWYILAWTAVTVAFGALLFSQIAPTAVDRFGLYLIPLQFYLWPLIVHKISDVLYQTILKMGLCATYLGVTVIWFSYAEHKDCWVPYNNFLLYFLS